MVGTPLLSAKIKSLCVSELNFPFSCDMVYPSVQKGEWEWMHINFCLRTAMKIF